MRHKHGPGHFALVAVERLNQPPLRLGLVRETDARQGLWVARFDDSLSTRLYVYAATGQLVAVRNEAWVWYDFFWRLHVMDYSSGEDFNNPLLRTAALLALGLLFSGLVLLGFSLRRR